jgi:hypothetical protein
MADNFPLTPGSGRNAATDQVTYSGDTADVQLVRFVQVTGSEGSKTVVDLPGDAANGLDVDVTRLSGALPAGTNLLGRVSSSDETSTVYNGTTALVPKFAAISASSSGNNTVVSAVSSKKIRVLRLSLSANGNVNAKFTDGAGGSDLTGLLYLTQYGGHGMAHCPVGLFETGSNTALVLNLSGAVAVGGCLTYVEV